MNKRVTVIVSDLHMGGGRADPGDDFIYQDSQFPRFLREQLHTAEGQRGDIELIINGDFLEFAQVVPEAYTIQSSRFWCSQGESQRKLRAILDGHPEVLDALREFQEPGNHVTIFAGNHDVDLYWPDVMGDLQRAVGDKLSVEVGEVWYSRYEGRLRISHGHMLDPANSFRHWDEPMLLADHGEIRLEMCPGTLFMVHFVNWLEAKYPLADNIHPVTRLADILWREDKYGWTTVAWMFSRFMRKHPAATAGSKQRIPTGERLVQMIAEDREFSKKVTELYRRAYDSADIQPEAVKLILNTEDAVSDFLYDLLPKVSPDEWLPVFERAKPAILSLAGKGTTLSVIRSGRMSADEACREAAKEEWAKGAQVVVMGHTHVPDSIEEGSCSYYNPGSWTRYLDATAADTLTLEDLRDENKFPYKLLYVRVEQATSGALRAEMRTVEEQSAKFV